MKSVFKYNLYRNPEIQIRRSTKHGWGIFACTNIKKYSMLEEVPYVLIPRKDLLDSARFNTYTYGYDDIKENLLIVGFGLAPLYNHSSNANANWMQNRANMTMDFYATRDIFADEEICIDYGEENVEPHYK